MSNADISIDGLTVTEKLGLMERLWVDLERHSSNIPTPSWHGDILSRRLQAVQNGDVEFSDWSDVKKRLQQRHS
jgi:putative addiction module component (TIGR02574 family)